MSDISTEKGSAIMIGLRPYSSTACLLAAAMLFASSIAVGAPPASSIGSVEQLSRRADGAPVAGESTQPVFSPRSASVVFTSTALGLFYAKAPASASQILLRAVNSTGIQVISLDVNGKIGSGPSFDPAFSRNANLIAFSTFAKNLSLASDGFAQIVVKNRIDGSLVTASSTIAGIPANGNANFPVFMPNGDLIFESNAPNLLSKWCTSNCPTNIIRKNLTSGAVSVISISKLGKLGNNLSRQVDFNQDGSLAVFASNASNLIDGRNLGSLSQIYLKNLKTGDVTLLSTTSGGTPGDGISYNPKFSPDGTAIAFFSTSQNLGAGATPQHHGQIYLKSLVTGKVRLISKNSHGIPADRGAYMPVFAPDGAHLTFVSYSGNLTAESVKQQIYYADLKSGAVSIISKNVSGDVSDSPCLPPSFAADGKSFVFSSKSRNLTPNLKSFQSNIFLSKFK